MRNPGRWPALACAAVLLLALAALLALIPVAI